MLLLYKPERFERETDGCVLRLSACALVDVKARRREQGRSGAAFVRVREPEFDEHRSEIDARTRGRIDAVLGRRQAQAKGVLIVGFAELVEPTE